MHAPVETEIKLLATTAMLDRLGDDPRLAGPQQQACYENAYYDTLGGALGRAGAALRLRRGAGAAEQTLKLAERAGSPLSRAEWTVPAAGDRLDLTLFPEPARTRLEPLLGGSAVACFARTLVHRTTRRLSHGASLIEVAFDRGTICARDREEPLAELELELVDGSAADLLALALELPLGPNLRWSVTGKAARARTLAFDLPPAAVRAAAVELPANATLAEGLRTISWNGVNQLLANYPLALALSDPEAVHQTRVAIRRLRTALALFSGGPEARIFAAEFRALALALAPARDLHLLHERAGCEVSRAGTEDLADLLAALAAGRDRALDAARQVLAGEPFQRLLVRFALWLEAADGLAAASHAHRPYRRQASRALTRQFARVTDRGRHFDHLSDRGRHKLRIAAKTLRYAAEFCPPDGNPSPGRRRFDRNLQRLQDNLGLLNDLSLAGAPPPALFADCDLLTRARLSAELEQVAGPSAKTRRRLLDRAARAFARLSECQPWWTGAPA